MFRRPRKDIRPSMYTTERNVRHSKNRPWTVFISVHCVSMQYLHYNFHVMAQYFPLPFRRSHDRSYAAGADDIVCLVRLQFPHFQKRRDDGRPIFRRRQRRPLTRLISTKWAFMDDVLDMTSIILMDIHNCISNYSGGNRPMNRWTSGKHFERHIHVQFRFPNPERNKPYCRGVYDLLITT